MFDASASVAGMVALLQKVLQLWAARALMVSSPQKKEEEIFNQVRVLQFLIRIRLLLHGEGNARVYELQI